MLDSGAPPRAPLIDVRDETIFSLLKAPAARSTTATWIWLLALVVVGWVGAVAFIGQHRQHEVVEILYSIAPARVLYAGAVAASLILFAGAVLAKRRALAGAALMVVAFLVGHQLYGWVYPHIPGRFRFPFHSNAEGFQFATGRVTYGITLVMPMLLAWLVMFRDSGRAWPRLRLGIGDLRVAGRDLGRSEPLRPWWQHLVGGYAGFCLVFFLIMQANVGFAPLVNGTLWPLLPAVFVAALANAIAEEYIFRGLVQPAFIRAGGVAAGLWMQGLMFGLMHWGMSVGLLAALPVSLLIGFGSVVWGKAALDTGGMAWVIAAHALVDIAVMSAFFVPRG